MNKENNLYIGLAVIALIIGASIQIFYKETELKQTQELYDQNIELQLRVSSLEYRFDKAMAFATFLISGVDPDIIMFDIYKEKLAIKD